MRKNVFLPNGNNKSTFQPEGAAPAASSLKSSYIKNEEKLSKERGTLNSNSYSKNHKVLKKEVSESHPWKDGEAIEFTVITSEIKQIYLDYDPQYVFFTIEMSASDPIGYSYNKAIYEVDMKGRWNAIRKK